MVLFGLLFPSLPTQKVDAEITDYGVEGVNLVKLHLAVLNAGQAHSVQEARGERGLAYEWAEKWLVISYNTYWGLSRTSDLFSMYNLNESLQGPV